jgi:hypothetical protein
MIAGCSIGSPSTFSLTNASVDASHTCPVGAVNVSYDLHGAIDVHNGTANAVTIRSVDAILTLAAVKGGWLQKVGDAYDAGNVSFTPGSVVAGANAALTLTVRSWCTGRGAGSPIAWGDYDVNFTMATSAGTFKVSSRDRHRIVTA